MYKIGMHQLLVLKSMIDVQLLNYCNGNSLARNHKRFRSLGEQGKTPPKGRPDITEVEPGLSPSEDAPKTPTVPRSATSPTGGAGLTSPAHRQLEPPLHRVG